MLLPCELFTSVLTSTHSQTLWVFIRCYKVLRINLYQHRVCFQIYERVLPLAFFLLSCFSTSVLSEYPELGLHSALFSLCKVCSVFTGLSAVLWFVNLHPHRYPTLLTPPLSQMQRPEKAGFGGNIPIIPCVS